MALAGLLAGCVWTPNHQDTVNRTVPFDVRGWSQHEGATITLQAWNHVHQRFDVVRSGVASTDPNWDEPHLYHYAIEDVLLGNQYWVPAGAGCETGGMASLQVLENGYKMVAYDDAQKSCVTTEVWNGAHPASAGQTCGTSNQLVLFSPPTC